MADEAAAVQPTAAPGAEQVPIGTESALDAKPTIFGRMTTLVKEKATEAQVAFQQASARITKRGSADGSTLPVDTQTGDSGTQNPVAPMANSLLEAAAGLTKRTKDTGLSAYQAAITSIRRLTAPTRRVAAVTKADLRTKPVPQVLLLTCNLVATKGLTCTGLFHKPADQTQVEALAARLEDRLLLLPADLDPALAAAVIVHFLGSLEEPLLSYRLVDRWVAAGKALSAGEAEGVVQGLLAELPLVNWSTLNLLMEMSYRVASQSNVTGKNAYGLATVLAPVLLWYEHPPGSSPGVSVPAVASGMVSQASSMATATIQALRSRLMHAPGTAEGGATLPTAGADATLVPPSAPAVEGEAPGATPAAEAPPPAKPHVVLDEQEEAELERTVVQHGAQPATAPAAGAGGVKGQTPLSGESLEAVTLLVEHLILNYDDLFLAST